MYSEIYSLLQTYIYGLDMALTPDMTLTLTLVSTIACLFLVSIPFLIVWKLICILMGGK